jgi:hypothetical protein
MLLDSTRNRWIVALINIGFGLVPASVLSLLATLTLYASLHDLFVVGANVAYSAAMTAACIAGLIGCFSLWRAALARVGVKTVRGLVLGLIANSVAIFATFGTLAVPIDAWYLFYSPMAVAAVHVAAYWHRVRRDRLFVVDTMG